MSAVAVDHDSGGSPTTTHSIPRDLPDELDRMSLRAGQTGVMAPKSITPVYTCEECGKTTTRLLGFVALLKLPGDGDRAAQTSRHTAVLGTCAAHRDRMAARFATLAAASGEVITVSDEPFELRPAHVDAWYAQVDQTFAQSLAEADHPVPNTAIAVNAPEDLPTACPHCGGELSWGTGRHVADAAARCHAQAWECLGCRAAGLLTDAPAR
ncbi:hypothetical protein [Nocardia sp. NPDC003979]